MAKTITQTTRRDSKGKPFKASQTIQGKFPRARKIVVNQVMTAKNKQAHTGKQSAKVKV